MDLMSGEAVRFGGRPRRVSLAFSASPFGDGNHYGDEVMTVFSANSAHSTVDRCGIESKQARQGRQTYFRLDGITGARHVYTNTELEQLADTLPTSGRASLQGPRSPRQDLAVHA